MKRKLNILLLFLIICLSTNIAAQDVKHEFRLGFVIVLWICIVPHNKTGSIMYATILLRPICF